MLLFFIFAVVFYSLNENRNQRESEMNQINSTLFLFNEKIDDFHLLSVTSLEMFTRNGDICHADVNDNYDDYVNQAIKDYSKLFDDTFSIAFATIDGDMYTRDNIVLPESYDPRARSWYVDALSSPENVFISKPYESAEKPGLYIITYSKAVISHDTGKIVGVAGLNVGLKSIVEFAKYLEIKDGAFVALTSEDGRVLINSKYSITDTQQTMIEFNSPLNESDYETATLIQDNQYSTYLRQNSKTKWIAALFIPRLSIWQKNRVLIIAVTFILILGIIFIKAFSKYLSIRISQSLNDIVLDIETIDIINGTQKIDDKKYRLKEIKIIVRGINNLLGRTFNLRDNLENTKTRQKTMISNISDVICIIESDYNIKYISSNVAKYFGWQPDEINGKSLLSTAHKEDLKVIESEFGKLMKNPMQTIETEYRFRCKDNKYKHIHLTGLNMINNTDLKGILVNFKDIEEKKKLEEKIRNQQKLEAIDTLASGIAHEINNPINGIMNYGQVILDSDECDDNIKEISKEIINESKRVSVIVRNLLEFSRKSNNSIEKIDVGKLVGSTLSLTKTLIRKDRILLEVNIEPNLPEINCNSQEIQQVIMNLITNSRDSLNEKYSGYHENKKIEISAVKSKDDDNKIQIIVKDHGKGITKSLQTRVFEPFFTTKSRSNGTGIGLSISYSIVKDHNGDLKLETLENEYTKFIIELPVKD